MSLKFWILFLVSSYSILALRYAFLFVPELPANFTLPCSVNLHCFGFDPVYNIVIEFDFTMKLVRLLKICLNATYSRFRVGIHYTHMLPLMNGLNKRFFIPTYFHLCFTVHHSVGSGEPQWLEINGMY